MREIKFRAWDKADKMMYAAMTSLHFDGIPHAATFIGALGDERTVRAENLELMQYAGLKDKNGKEIYEGDILGREEHECMDGQPVNSYLDTCQVIWHQSAWYCDFWGNENLSIDDYDSTTGEVIGNIYENPELVEA